MLSRVGQLAGFGLVLALALVGCGSDDEPASPGSGGTAGTAGSAGTAGTSGAGPIEWPHVTCDPLVPSYCGFPFPSNVYTVADASTPTGRRVVLDTSTLPTAKNGNQTDTSKIPTGDGFSAGAALLCELPGAKPDGLPSWKDPAESLADGSPTVLLDAETGQRVAHFAELDASTANPPRALMIRPLERLEDGRRYIAAVRNVQGAEASEAFKALRDDLPYEADESIDARRGLYADIFTKLEAAGVARSSLQLAWDFTTASRESNTQWLVHMRDEALAAAGDSGPSYTIDSVDANFDPAHIKYKIVGKMTVPLYLSKGGPGGNLILGSDGMPEPNAATPTYEVPFEVLIPLSAETKPAALLQYGHGLLGSYRQVEAFAELINTYNYVMFGVNLDGMAEDDQAYIIEVITSGKMEGISAMFDRMHQGALNNLLLMRMMKNAFSKDATYGQYLDPNERYYHGISQGGIFGGVYMSLSTDVTRGVLGVMGQPYNLLLDRSVDFNPFFVFLRLSYPDPRDPQFLLSVVQLLWDRVEPNGYTKYIRENMLPGTPAHEVLMRAAVGDHQVTNIGGQLMARAVGAQHLDSGIRDVYGLDKVTGATSGSAYVEYDFGLPEIPACNIPMSSCSDPHGKLRKLTESQQQLDLFLRTGEIKNFCSSSECKFPTQSGCMPGEMAPMCPAL